MDYFIDRSTISSRTLGALGRHILVEFLDCDPAVLNDVTLIEQAMVAAAKGAGATVITSNFHHFSPYGVSGVVVIQESHLAIHTWPEYGYAAVDLFTCGEQVDPWIAFEQLKHTFVAQTYSAMECKRGMEHLLKKAPFKLDHPTASPLVGTNVWFTDRDEHQAHSLRYTGEVFYRHKSPFQAIEILESTKYGRMLTLDGVVMTTEKDEAHYHEMLVHPALLSLAPTPKRVLVIGGGDGGTIRELFKHEQVEQVTLVEIDVAVIEACKAFLPDLACCFDHPKLELQITDGLAFVRQSTAQYDLILVDSCDPIGPAQGLFTAQFYRDCQARLTPKGLLIVQGQAPFFNEQTFVELNHCLRTIFPLTGVNLVQIPTYPTGVWAFQWGIQAPLTADRSRVEAFTQQHPMRYYNWAMHASLFAIPQHVEDLIGPQHPIFV